MSKQLTCGYCKYSIANASERYYKKEYSKKYQKDITYPTFVHYRCAKEIFAKGENVWTYHNNAKTLNTPYKQQSLFQRVFNN